MLFISDVQNYIPIKLCKTSGSIHLFKIKGTLKSKDIKLNRNYLWDTLEINWNKITITFNDNKIDFPKIVTIKMRDKIRVRRLVNREPLNLHIMIRQGITWYNLETEIENSITTIYISHFRIWHVYFSQSATSCTVSSGANSQQKWWIWKLKLYPCRELIYLEETRQHR